MRIALERRQERVRRQERLDIVTKTITQQSEVLQEVAIADAKRVRDRTTRAATLINAASRGRLGRILAGERKMAFWAAGKVQAAYRGLRGRRRTMEERWRKVRVAPSKYALNLLRNRSTIVAVRDPWFELFDPSTNTFWYLNKKTAHSSWTAPPEFEVVCFCAWDPWPHPYISVSDSSQPCRAQFDTRAAFHAHRTTAHSWICPACEAKNVSVAFPSCSVCGNRLDKNTGADLTMVLESKLDFAFRKFKLDQKRAARRRNLPASEQGEDKEASSNVQKGSLGLLGESLHEDSNEDGSGSSGSEGEGEENGERNLEALASPAFLQGFEGAPPASKVSIAGEGKATTTGRNESSNGSSNTVAEPALGSDEVPGSAPPEGLSNQLSAMAQPDNSGSSGNNSSGGNVGLAAAASGADAALANSSSSNSNGASSSGAAEGGEAPSPNAPDPSVMQACPKFVMTKCTKIGCAMAHPGMRDKSRAYHAGGTGSKKKWAVKLCETVVEHQDPGAWQQHCPHGNECPCYHPYVRPATMDLIRRLYPVRKGRRMKSFPSGAVLDGVMGTDEHGNSNFNGYGVFTWASGDTYLGDWVNGQRHGVGLFRSVDGREFCGQWSRGVRHGWGCLTHANGEDYEGEFKDGKVHGVGRLTSPNGDVYQGAFRANKFHGLGRFTKGNGDTYLGQCSNGRAEGWGVLALATGERYKGQFTKDKRSGKGVAIYPNGCRYAGQWLHGVHNGFGMFTTLSGERYVGTWQKGQKHGRGRYVFKGGDFYDGDFVRNHAHGDGIYWYAATGNVFAGQFKEDKKCGRGVYVWQSGSRFEGYFKDNGIHGKGVFDFANGSKYQGEFEHNHKHGRGIYTWKTGNKYRGNFEYDALSGFGEMIYNAMNHRYVGHWKNNKKDGEGTFWYSDGNVYTGMWRNDIKHGLGKLRYRPGTLVEESYEGEFDRGVRHGHGIYRYKQSDGVVYEGEWHRGLRHGLGTIRWADGRFYRGYLVRERQCGRGLMVWPDGSQYDGEWHDNQRHGEGTYLAPNGVIYQGRWCEDQKQGPGSLTYVDGNTYIGEWESDQIKGIGSFKFLPSKDEGEKVINLKVFGF